MNGLPLLTQLTHDERMKFRADPIFAQTVENIFKRAVKELNQKGPDATDRQIKLNVYNALGSERGEFFWVWYTTYSKYPIFGKEVLKIVETIQHYSALYNERFNPGNRFD